MKATVHYDSKGDIQSVVLLHAEARTTAKSAHYDSIEIELDDVSPAKVADVHARLAEVHSKHRVDTVHRKLVRR